MPARYAYLDASAIVKLIVAEPETAALERDAASREGLLTSAITAVEVTRAARRTASRRILQRTDDVLDALFLLDLTPAILHRAGRVGPSDLRTLDVIHLASAVSIESEDVAFITYDQRLAAVAGEHGLVVVQPGR